MTENGYLRLDPFIIYHPIYEAGLYLAKQGKEECLICVEGLKQYSIPFPSVWVLAEEIEGIFASTVAVRNAQAPVPGHPPITSGSGQIVNHSISYDSSDTQSVQDPSWSSKSTEGMNMAMPMPLAMATSPGIGGAGTNRDFWPDGTPVPSRDVAWTLFDWMHQM